MTDLFNRDRPVLCGLPRIELPPRILHEGAQGAGLPRGDTDRAAADVGDATDDADRGRVGHENAFFHRFKMRHESAPGLKSKSGTGAFQAACASGFDGNDISGLVAATAFAVDRWERAA